MPEQKPYTDPWAQDFQRELSEARNVAQKSESQFREWLFGEQAMKRWDRWCHIHEEMKVTTQWSFVLLADET